MVIDILSSENQGQHYLYVNPRCHTNRNIRSLTNTSMMNVITTLIVVSLLRVCASRFHSLPHSSEPSEDWIRPASTYGINAFQSGKFFNFKTFWNQIFVLKFPRRHLNYIIPRENCSTLRVENYLTQAELLISVGHNESSVDLIRRHESILHDECANFTIALNQLKSEMDFNIYLYAHELTLLNLKRNKRQLVVAGAFLVGALFSWLVYPHHKEHVANEIDTMHAYVMRSREADMMLTRSMIGMSNIVDARTNMLREKQTTLIRHYNIVQEQMAQVRANVLNQSFIDAISFDANHRLIQLLSAKGDVSFEFLNRLHEFTEFQEGLVELQRGHLSHKLINFSKLREKLIVVGSNLPKGYKIALEANQWDLFYSLPLTAYTIHSDQVFIRLSIPVSVDSEPLIFDMYRLSSLPVPCDHFMCTKNAPGDFGLQFELRETMIIRIQNLIMSVNKDEIKCASTGIGDVCWTFNQNSVQPLNPCLRAITNWSPQTVNKYCKMSYFPLDYYTPPRVVSQTYALHLPIVKSYTVECPDFNISNSLTTWSEIVTVPPKCKLHFNNDTFYGDLNLNLTTPVTFQKFNFTLFQGILSDVEQPIINISSIKEPTVPTNQSDFRDNLQSLTNKLLQERARLLKDNLFNHPYYLVQTMIENTWTVLTSLFFTWFLTIQIRNNNWFYLTQFRFIENIDVTYCFDGNDFYEFVSFNYYSLFVNIITIALFGILFLFTIRYCFFPKYVFNNYVGYHGEWEKEFRFCIAICIEDTIDYLSCRKYCQTHIYISLPEFNDEKFITVETNFGRKTYSIMKDILRIGGSVEVRGVDHGGRILDAKIYKLELPISELVWAKNRKPARLGNLGGFCTIAAIADPTPI